ncbi:MAG TPA: universal stress protein [Streptosporangiaceae bacterium]|jgi:nucleotide-binding universal stress UspA family protein|nr:universal stress protein [Streptosporangiaceae bacterium]
MTRVLLPRRIVVGVDGSAAADAAVRWAVAEARLRHAAVHLVCACPSDVRLRAPYAPSSWRPPRDECDAAGKEILAGAAAAVRHRLPPGRLISELVSAPPAQALLDRTAGAEMLVLGTWRASRVAGQPPPPLGPVARACLRLAHCPVVIVEPDGQAAGRVGQPAHGRYGRSRHRRDRAPAAAGR